MSPIEKAAADALAAQQSAEQTVAVQAVATFTTVPTSSLTVAGHVDGTTVVTDGTVNLAVVPGGVSVVVSDGAGGWTQTAGPIADLPDLGSELKV